MDLLAKHKLIFCLLLILAGQEAKAQSHEHGHEDHEQHVHPKNEIAVANSMVYICTTSEVSMSPASAMALGMNRSLMIICTET